MTAYKNMAFGLELRKTLKDERRRRVNEAAGVLGIVELLDRKPKALSGGQCQRAALGRAMVRNPTVFLLDESLSNLDAKIRASMRAELIKLHRRLETTFVYVTHDQIEAMIMGYRIVVMKDGLIQQINAPQRLYDAPRNLFAAGFIGNPRMNLIEGAEGDIWKNETRCQRNNHKAVWVQTRQDSGSLQTFCSICLRNIFFLRGRKPDMSSPEFFAW
jgi:multiple sugar transport system ATP-binding protein